MTKKRYMRRVVTLARAEPSLPTESVLFQAGVPGRVGEADRAMMTTKRIDLDAIEARATAATPGPWSVSVDGITVEDPDGRDVCDAWQSDGDAAFIAHARADVPALIDELRALREVERAARVYVGLHADLLVYPNMTDHAAVAAYDLRAAIVKASR